MANIIEQAKKGQRSALTALYQTNKQKVYFLALCLLKDSAQAEKATAAVFREGWTSLRTEQIHTQQQFASHIVSKTVGYCKTKLYQKNPKALRLPFNKDFSIPVNTLARGNYNTAAEYYLGNLPAMQRYIFAMHTVGELEVLQIGRILKFDAKTVNLALDTQAENWNRLKKLSAKGYDATYDELVQELRQAEADCLVPEPVENQIAAIVGDIARPGEEKARKMKYHACIFFTLILACVLILALVFGLRDCDDSDADENTQEKTQSTEATDGTDATDPEATYDALDENLTYYADIVIEDYGTITVQLDQYNAPITCANFVELAESGFYDGLTFHRIIEGTMMQGGCPEGTGYGSADNTIVGEFADNGYKNDLSHTRGAISMARSSDYDSASCQFFIVQEDYTDWDGQYAVFGYVISGMDVVDAVCAAAENTDGNGSIAAEDQPVIQSITIRTTETQ